MVAPGFTKRNRVPVSRFSVNDAARNGEWCGSGRVGGRWPHFHPSHFFHSSSVATTTNISTKERTVQPPPVFFIYSGDMFWYRQNQWWVVYVIVVIVRGQQSESRPSNAIGIQVWIYVRKASNVASSFRFTFPHLFPLLSPTTWHYIIVTFFKRGGVRQWWQCWNIQMRREGKRRCSKKYH